MFLRSMAKHHPSPDTISTDGAKTTYLNRLGQGAGWEAAYLHLQKTTAWGLRGMVAVTIKAAPALSTLDKQYSVFHGEFACQTYPINVYMMIVIIEQPVGTKNVCDTEHTDMAYGIK